MKKEDLLSGAVTLSFDDGGRGFAGWLTFDYLDDETVEITDRFGSVNGSVSTALKKGNAFIKEALLLYGVQCTLTR